MKIVLLFSSVLAFLYSGCSSKNMTVNGLICPAGHTNELIQADFRECYYYDMKAIEVSATPKIDEECLKCLEAKGYVLE
ncbi:MAG: hypothetical protein U9P71_01775 [Campylobacterota bacterium]|nr:hypothetical protein [Campylobacterota bacterium]